LSFGNPVFAAVLSATVLITPYVHTMTKSGFACRICNHCDSCVVPGSGTGIFSTSYPYFCESASRTGIGSLPYAES
jgi:hypothetical protein